MSVRVRFALLSAVSAALIAATPALANPSDANPAAPPARTAPAPSPYDPALGMEFRLVEGRGPFGLTRWIQASGEVQPDTGTRFEAFARTMRVSGLTVALDSGGGNMQGGLALGRAMRAAGVNTTVGRTVVRREDGHDISTLVTHLASCDSACSYAFLGGVQRRISQTARLGVHQFTNTVLMNERSAAEAFRFAQAYAAHVAVYLQEMGADIRFLMLASSQETGIRDVTVAEHQLLGSAVVSDMEAQRLPVGWSVTPRQHMLYRRETRLSNEALRVDQEVLAFCGADDTFSVQARIILARAPSDREFALEAVRLDLGMSWLDARRPDGQPIRMRGQDNSLSASFIVPRDALIEAVRSGHVAIGVPDGSDLAGLSDVAEGLAEALPALIAGCNAMERRQLAAR